jgi:hypothetical protein
LQKGLGLFVVVSVLGLVLVFYGSSEPAAFREIAGRVRPGYLVLCLVAVPVFDWVSAGFRMWLFTAAISPGVSYAACVRNCAVGGFMGAATPSQTGGSVAQAYVLIREGAAPGEALAVLFMTFLSTLVFYLAASLALWWLVAAGFLSGFGSPALFTTAVVLFAALTGLGILVMAFPDGARARIAGWAARWGRGEPPGGVTKWILESLGEGGRALRMLRGTLKWRFVFSLAVTTVVFGNKFFAALLAARALGLSPSISQIMVSQLLLNVIIYFFPTPGGSGGAEVSAGVVMAGIIPGPLLPGFTFLWRTATMYLSVLAGGLILAWYARRERQP